MADLLTVPESRISRSDRRYTADDFLRLCPEGPHDLIEGVVVPRRYSGQMKGAICATLAHLLQMRLDRSKWMPFCRVGVICGQSPDTVVCPDFAVSVTRRVLKGFSEIPPLVAGFVRCPSNPLEDYDDRVRRLFDAGVRETWVFNPDTREAEVFRPDVAVRRVLSDGAFETDELPGFSATLAECFEDLD